jgi:hypothetical protein
MGLSSLPAYDSGTRVLDTQCNKRAPPRQAPQAFAARRCDLTRDDNLLSASPGCATG